MLERIFFNDKPLKTLISLLYEDEIWYPLRLCKATDCTYPHMVKILEKFEKYGLIKTKGQGRLKTVKLTGKGKKLAKKLADLVDLMEKIEEEIGPISEDQKILEVKGFSANQKLSGNSKNNLENQPTEHSKTPTEPKEDRTD